MKTAIIAELVLSGCATITNGTSQDITFAVPEHQVCAVSRVDGVLGSVQTSAPTITVQRSRDPITLDCGDSVTVYEPAINAAGYTSIGLIDFGLVDFATGALWEYGEAGEMKAKKDDAICDFCGSHQDFRLIIITRGSDKDMIHICDECVDKCANLVATKRAEKLDKQKTSP